MMCFVVEDEDVLLFPEFTQCATAECRVRFVSPLNYSRLWVYFREEEVPIGDEVFPF
jgi:hypothetical protein